MHPTTAQPTRMESASLFGVEEALDHDPHDDTVGQVVLNHLLRDGNPDSWAVMLSDRYAEQTARILRHFLRQSELAIDDRDRKAEEDRLAHEAGLIDTAEYFRRYAEHTTWRNKTIHFQNLVHTWWDQAHGAELRVRSQVTGPVDTLLEAIEQHRRGTLGLGEAPSKADRMLWKAADKVREGR